MSTATARKQTKTLIGMRVHRLELFPDKGFEKRATGELHYPWKKMVYDEARNRRKPDIRSGVRSQRSEFKKRLKNSLGRFSIPKRRCDPQPIRSFQNLLKV